MKKVNISFTALALMLSMNAFSQTNVFDDIIAPSPNHTYLEAAILQEGLEGALQDPNATLTVFAPDDAAFTNLATALNTDIAGLLALPNLTDILLYHVLDSEVPAAAVTNGAVVQPLSTTNTLKMTVTSMGGVYANQAQVSLADLPADNGVVHVLDAVVLPDETVIDIALDNGFTTLATAVIQEELLPVLTDPLATFTVFAPTNTAFDNLATALNTDIAGLLALPNLSDVLTYHVLSSEVAASQINNGDVVQPISVTNSLKMTVTSMGDVYANQAQVSTADIMSSNGTVHVLDAVVLPDETVVDVALDNGFTTLATAVIQEELLPVLTDPLASFTVFAPTNEAFDNLATGLNTDVNGLLALPNLSDILTYHVLNTEVASSQINNGDVVQPISMTNSLKMTVTAEGGVFANQAQVSMADITSSNGTVHVLDAVVLPDETVIDVALDNGFTTLATAVIQEELVPTLSDPLAEFTVFAPTNAAFDDLAMALGTDINGILANPDLTDILLYHVVSGTVMSGDLTNGMVPTLNGQSVTVDLSSGVMINSSNVTMADVTADNGVVHVLDAVLLPSASIDEEDRVQIEVFPNPASDQIKIVASDSETKDLAIYDLNGKVVFKSTIVDEIQVDVSKLVAGSYIVDIASTKRKLLIF